MNLVPLIIGRAKSIVFISFRSSVNGWQEKEVIKAVDEAIAKGIRFIALIGPDVVLEENPVLKRLKVHMDANHRKVEMRSTQEEIDCCLIVTNRGDDYLIDPYHVVLNSLNTTGREQYEKFSKLISNGRFLSKLTKR